MLITLVAGAWLVLMTLLIALSFWKGGFRSRRAEEEVDLERGGPPTTTVAVYYHNSRRRQQKKQSERRRRRQENKILQLLTVQEYQTLQIPNKTNNEPCTTDNTESTTTATAEIIVDCDDDPLLLLRGDHDGDDDNVAAAVLDDPDNAITASTFSNINEQTPAAATTRPDTGAIVKQEKSRVVEHRNDPNCSDDGHLMNEYDHAEHDQLGMIGDNIVVTARAIDRKNTTCGVDDSTASTSTVAMAIVHGDDDDETNQDENNATVASCCAICLEAFQSHDRVCQKSSLPAIAASSCRHTFHVDCMARWLASRAVQQQQQSQQQSQQSQQQQQQSQPQQPREGTWVVTETKDAKDQCCYSCPVCRQPFLPFPANDQHQLQQPRPSNMLEY